MPVVLAAGSSGQCLLHEAIGHGMEADFNRKGVSIYSDKIGKQIAKPFVNIVDEGRRTAARGAIKRGTTKGTPSGKTSLVENGILTNLPARFDLGKALQGGPDRERAPGELPVRPHAADALHLHAPRPAQERRRSSRPWKNGIYCTNFTNGQVNIGAGDFTFYVKNGFLIEDGKLTKPIKDVNIIGNGPKVLEKVDMVSDDLAIDEGAGPAARTGRAFPSLRSPDRAVLLIVAILIDAQLREYVSLAESAGLSALVEVHDELELDRALATGARLVGRETTGISERFRWISRSPNAGRRLERQSQAGDVILVAGKRRSQPQRRRAPDPSAAVRSRCWSANRWFRQGISSQKSRNCSRCECAAPAGLEPGVAGMQPLLSGWDRPRLRSSFHPPCP